MVFTFVQHYGTFTFSCYVYTLPKIEVDREARSLTVATFSTHPYRPKMEGAMLATCTNNLQLWTLHIDQ